jgi:hypothetical protein
MILQLLATFRAPGAYQSSDGLTRCRPDSKGGDMTDQRASATPDDRVRASARQTGVSDEGVAADPRGPWYRREPWLAVVFTSVAPIVASIFVPNPARVALVALGALAFGIGVWLLLRQEVRDRRRAAGDHRSPTATLDRSGARDAVGGGLRQADSTRTRRPDDPP